MIQSRYILSFTPPDDGGEWVQVEEKRLFDLLNPIEKLDMLVKMLGSAKSENAEHMYSLTVELIQQ